MRRAIPIAPQQQPAPNGATANHPRTALIGVAVILLHVASIAFALSRF